MDQGENNTVLNLVSDDLASNIEEKINSGEYFDKQEFVNNLVEEQQQIIKGGDLALNYGNKNYVIEQNQGPRFVFDDNGNLTEIKSLHSDELFYKVEGKGIISSIDVNEFGVNEDDLVSSNTNELLGLEDANKSLTTSYNDGVQLFSNFAEMRNSVSHDTFDEDNAAIESAIYDVFGDEADAILGEMGHAYSLAFDPDTHQEGMDMLTDIMERFSDKLSLIPEGAELQPDQSNFNQVQSSGFNSFVDRIMMIYTAGQDGQIYRMENTIKGV